MSLNHQVVLVTGAAAGIGEQCARKLVSLVYMESVHSHEVSKLKSVYPTAKQGLQELLAGFESSALTGQSVILSHGWAMQ